MHFFSYAFLGVCLSFSAHSADTQTAAATPSVVSEAASDPLDAVVAHLKTITLESLKAETLQAVSEEHADPKDHVDFNIVNKALQAIAKTFEAEEQAILESLDTKAKKIKLKEIRKKIYDHQALWKEMAAIFEQYAKWTAQQYKKWDQIRHKSRGFSSCKLKNIFEHALNAANAKKCQTVAHHEDHHEAKVAVKEPKVEVAKPVVLETPQIPAVQTPSPAVVVQDPATAVQNPTTTTPASVEPAKDPLHVAPVHN